MGGDGGVEGGGRLPRISPSRSLLTSDVLLILAHIYFFLSLSSSLPFSFFSVCVFLIGITMLNCLFSSA